MGKKQDNAQEKILYEGIVFCEKYKSDVNLIVTTKQIIVEKEKGLFVKKLKPVEKIDVDNIKVINDRVQVKATKKSVGVVTTKGSIVFDCKNFIDSNKIKEHIIYAKTGERFIERNKSNAKELVNVASAVVATISAGYGAFKAGRKAYGMIVEAVKNIK